MASSMCASLGLGKEANGTNKVAGIGCLTPQDPFNDGDAHATHAFERWHTNGYSHPELWDEHHLQD